MCDPVSLLGAAASVGSVIANSSASNSVAKARSNALALERTRQQGLDAEAHGVNEHSRKLYDGMPGQQDARAKTLGDYFTEGNGAAPGNVGAGATAPTETMPQSSSGLVVSEQKKQGGKAAAFGTQQGEALGSLRSFGDVMGTAGRSQARDAGQIGQIGSFKQGSSAVLPYELEAANTKGAGMKMLGDVLGGAGQLGIAAGLGRNTAPGLGAGAANVATSLPSFAQPQATAPMSLGSPFSAIPSFSRVGNLFGSV